MPTELLRNVKAVEWGYMVAAPYCSRLLAALGAKVIKVEPPGRGDTARRRGPFFKDTSCAESGLFLYLNTDKLGITLDVARNQGRDIFLELLQHADLLVENQPLRLLEELHLTYDDLRQSNPRLVVTSLSPFGRTGPYRYYKAYPLNVFHSGGEGYVTPGNNDDTSRPPLKIANYFGDYVSGIGAALGSLAAIWHQRETGEGQLVDISQQEELISLNPTEFESFPNYGLVTARNTPAYRYAGITRCKDGYVQITCYSDAEWEATVRLMGSPAWARDEKFKDSPSRTKNRQELNERLAQWAREHTKEEIFRQGQARGCATAPYHTVREVTQWAQLKHREYFREVTHPTAGMLKYPYLPFRLRPSSATAPRAAPTLGQHNEAVLCNWLGYSESELKQWQRDGVV